MNNESSALINKKAVRSSKPMKLAQKAAKKRYGKVRTKLLKMKINKVVVLRDEQLMSFSEESSNINSRLLADLNTDRLIEKVKELKLEGLSGGCFPTAEKLEGLKASKAVDKYLIINGVECDPCLLHDEWLINNKYEQLRQGAELLQRCFDFKEIILASKCEKAFDDSSLIHTVKVPDKYPMGYEKLLISFLLGIELKEGEYPTARGILVMNIQTVLALFEMLGTDGIQKGRYLTLADLESGQAVIARADFGTSAAKILKKAFPQSNGKMYAGEGAMNCHEIKENEGITANTNLLAYGAKPDYVSAASCKGCGGCTSKCPEGIDVRSIVKAIEKKELDIASKKDFERFHTEKCIGCCTCTYICMAGKDLHGIIAQINGK